MLAAALVVSMGGGCGEAPEGDASDSSSWAAARGERRVMAADRRESFCSRRVELVVTVVVMDELGEAVFFWVLGDPSGVAMG